MDANSRPAQPIAGEESEGSNHSQSDHVSWISWYCSLEGNEFFVEVDDGFARDAFNLTGLTSQVPYFDRALDAVLDSPNHSLSDESLTDEQQEVIDSAAEMLYGLIHARFVITPSGLEIVREKFLGGDFGRCPRVLCSGQPMLPVGQSDVPASFTLRLYCPKCQDIYAPKSSRHDNLDGAYFGTSLPHLFLLTFPDLEPAEPTHRYHSRVFGFRVHMPQGPRRCISAGRDIANEHEHDQDQTHGQSSHALVEGGEVVL